MNAQPASSQIGLVGLAVMGQNLALNIARRGFPITVYNRTTEKTRAFVAEEVRDEPVVAAETVEELVRSLARPRRILLMVKAGKPVDQTIAQIAPLLEDGDVIVDGGNSHPDDTERRAGELAQRGLRFVGMGVSGGEEGALHGPSLMPGGPPEAYRELEPILTKIAAQVDDGPCVTHVGKGGAGHFVKMVHNGIEYGDMQLIAEAHDLMATALGLSVDQQAAVFERWNEGLLESYLIEITGKILRHVDRETGKPMVEVILDRAGQKGTGRWTAQIALELGIPLPTIHGAVDARILSSRKEERRRASERLAGPDTGPITDRRAVEDVHDALYASKICSYAQGMDLMRSASEERGWGIDVSEVARIWKGGCIIRARMLDRIKAAYRKDPALPNLLLSPELGGWISEHQDGWRRIVGLAAEHGVPALSTGASLAYYDSYRREHLPQNLVQAQRDFFGAHTYERVDRPAGEMFHTEWT